ncbi:MAG: pyrroloquinoline quinone precursor peptide PqqA [Hyphomicrobiaceae bacterium]
MKTWNKPVITETETSLEVTTYISGELDLDE